MLDETKQLFEVDGYSFCESGKMFTVGYDGTQNDWKEDTFDVQREYQAYLNEIIVGETV